MPDRAVFHLPEGDAEYGHRAFRNVENLLADDSIDATVAIVANGGGVSHLQAEAPTADRVRELLESGVEVYACRNAIERAAFGVDDLIEEIDIAASGMAELTRKQADGYAYIRP